MAAYTLSIKTLTECGACKFSYFYQKSGGASEVTFPGGWTDTESEMAAGEDLPAFLFLVSKQLIPVTVLQARRIIERVHGTSAKQALHAALRANP